MLLVAVRMLLVAVRMLLVAVRALVTVNVNALQPQALELVPDGTPGRQLGVVGHHHQHRLLPPVQVEEHVGDHQAGGAVEIAGGLVAK